MLIKSDRMKRQAVHGTKYSYGVACCRVNSAGQYEVLLINKRNTYAFVEFVCGKYQGICGAKALFAHMTMDEKVDIASMNFDQMWYHAWLADRCAARSEHYERCRRKFHDTFIRYSYAGLFDVEKNWAFRREELYRALDTTGTAERVWEIPKGRRIGPENELDCAIREFGEETGIEKTQYQILPGWSKKSEQTDNGIRYMSHYYLALASGKFEPHVSLRNAAQIAEIIDIRWVSAEMAAHLPGCRDLPLIRAIIKTMKSVSSARQLRR